VNKTTISRLALVDLTDFPDVQRERYWEGDTGILDRYVTTVPTCSVRRRIG
jgi:hypothetical protein